ncbi:LacI family DNA-binding transcriptional regulator [Anaerolineales bacterium]
MLIMANKFTIKQIAELAGVSKATVSRVLNDYAHIRPELRERVQKVIEETGYERNTVARLLATDRSNMIGLLIPSGAKAVFTDPYFPKLTLGISRGANQYDLTLVLFLFQSEEEGLETVKSIISNGLLDGLIITADRKGDVLLQRLIEAEMCFVQIGRPEYGEVISYVDTDNFSGGRIATQHLIDQGYRRIGLIGCNHNLAADDRYDGYRQALEDNGIAYDPSIVTNGDFSLESGEACMEALISKDLEAVFVVSDTMSLGALRTLRKYNINVPEDLALMSFDDLPPAIQADPPLTTIRQPIEESGFLAVEVLRQLIERPELAPIERVLPTQLIIRSSV